MKNRLKRIFALLIVCSMMFSVIACGEKNPVDTQTNTTDTEDDGTAPVVDQHGEFKEVFDRADEIAKLPVWDEVFDDDFKVTEPLKWLTWYEVDKNSPTMATYKAVFGDIDGYEQPVERLNCSYENRYESLNNLVGGGNPPDMFQFEERFFPFGAYEGFYQPVDDIFDFDRPEWDNTRDVMELFSWGGKNYTAITELTNSTANLFYLKSVADGAGLDDPFTVWRNGDWTWEVFEDMVTQFSQTDEKWGIISFYIDEAAILSTGTPILGLKDGLLVNNMYERPVERACELLKNLALGDFRYPYHELSDFKMNYNAFRQGKILFFGDGPWEYNQKFAKFAVTDNWDEDEFRIVPFPRDPDPSVDTHYMRGKQDAMMLVRGSTNKNGFKAWTYSALIAQQDEKMREAGRNRDKKNLGWTDDQLDVLEELRDPERTTLVWDFKNGIGLDIGDLGEFPVERLTKPVIVHGESYAELRTSEEKPIIKRIGEINDAAKKQMEENG
ncbi:MAG: extracellular solute-binding protein [Oscillospiraceae bacterium]|nr:extracellular solute-binding protein [Oscillospiraceae bacterium]